MRFLVLPIIILMIGCNTCPCVNRDVQLNFIGFDSTEVSPVIVEKFEKGSRFSKKLDSLSFMEGDFRLKKKNDTITFPIRAGDFGITAQHDWKITLPAAMRTFLITEIDSEQITGSCPHKVQCVNPVTSASIDGASFYFNLPFHVFLKR